MEWPLPALHFPALPGRRCPAGAPGAGGTAQDCPGRFQGSRGLGSGRPLSPGRSGRQPDTNPTPGAAPGTERTRTAPARLPPGPAARAHPRRGSGPTGLTARSSEPPGSAPAARPGSAPPPA